MKFRWQPAHGMTTSQARLFTRPDAWSGGSYELAMVLGPPSDDRLRPALQAVWTFGDLDGCYLHCHVEREEQARILPSEIEPNQFKLYGHARPPSGAVVPCSTIVARLEEEVGSVEAIDCLYFGLPLGSLGLAYPVGAFPFEDGNDLSWREALDGWLCRLAECVFARVPFRGALVGWTEGEDEDRLLRGDVPDQRWVGYLKPSGQGLRWYPPTEGAPFRFGKD